MILSLLLSTITFEYFQFSQVALIFNIKMKCQCQAAKCFVYCLFLYFSFIIFSFCYLWLNILHIHSVIMIAFYFHISIYCVRTSIAITACKNKCFSIIKINICPSFNIFTEQYLLSSLYWNTWILIKPEIIHVYYSVNLNFFFVTNFVANP